MNRNLFETAGVAAALTLSLLAGCGPQAEPAVSVAANPASGAAQPEGPKPMVTGTPGDETVAGGDAAEQIVASPGADILSGGAGADDFILETGFGRDWIADFQADEGDRIVVRLGSDVTVGEHEGQLVLDFGAGDVLGFVGVPRSAFSEAWLVMG